MSGYCQNYIDPREPTPIQQRGLLKTKQRVWPCNNTTWSKWHFCAQNALYKKFDLGIPFHPDNAYHCMDESAKCMWNMHKHRDSKLAVPAQAGTQAQQGP